MPEQILGLDIGARRIKAVSVTRSLRSSYLVTGAEVIDIPEAGGVPEALKKLFANEAFRHLSCATSIPANNASFRNISLPFRDKKKIKQTIAFELEPLIHYPIDEAVVECTIVSHKDRSKIFAAVVNRSFLEDRISLISEHVKNLRAIDIDPVPLASKLLANPEFVVSGLLLDIGAVDSVAVFVQRGAISHVRHYVFGGEHLTQTAAPAVHAGTTEEEMNKKEARDTNGEGHASRVCERFFIELRNTMEFLKWNCALEERPSKIFLTGGGALYKGFKENLANYFSIPVELVDISSTEGIHLDETVKNQWEPLFMNNALALATRPMNTEAGFNFKSNKFKEKDTYDQTRDYFRKVAVVVLPLLLIAGTDVYLDYHYDRSRLSKLKGEIASEFKNTFPEVTRIVDPVQQFRAKIAEAKKASLGLNETASGATILDMLREISSLAPASTDLLVTNFTFENDSIAMKGEAKNFNAVDVIKSEFAKSRFFKSVTIGSTSLMKQGDKVEFDLRIMMK
jgi:general secretion pathway protein L